MKLNLNDMIAAAVSGDFSDDVLPEDAAGVIQEEPVNVPEVDADEAEKLASALDYIGRKGVGTFVKIAGAADVPEGTNMGQRLANTTKTQVGPHAGAPPMKEPGLGLIPNNAGKKPGLPAPAGGIDVGSQGKGTHHSALASNDAAIAFTKKEKAKKTSGALKAVLDNPPWADSKLKELLDHTEGDKNIHSKSAQDKELIRQALVKKLATAKEAQA